MSKKIKMQKSKIKGIIQNIKVLTFVFLLGFVIFGVFSGAATATVPVLPPCEVSPDGSLNLANCNPLRAAGVNDIKDLACKVTQFLATKLMPPILVLMVLWASFLYLTAAGKPQNVTSAKQVLIFAIIGAGILILAPALVALVAGIFGAGETGTSSACRQLTTTASFMTVIANLINWFSWFLAIVSVVMGLYSGFTYMTSQGEPQKITIASKTLFYAVIGVAVAILAFGILALIEGFIVQ